MNRYLTCVALLALITLGVAYLASPLLAAYKLRHAVRTGDTTTLERMIAWPSLRASVRATIARNARLLPVATEVARNIRPTMWQRIRSLFGHSMLDRFIETYITPTGLPKLYRAKTRWHERFKSPRYPAVVLAGIAPDKLVRAWHRIKRAEFKSPFRFVLEVQDRHVASRFITSTFQLSTISLSGFDWKLSGIAIRHRKAGPVRLRRLNGF